MANIMTTFITITDTDLKVNELFSSWIDVEKKKDYTVESINMNRMFSDIYNIQFNEEEHLNRSWMNDNVGSKWIEFSVDYIDEDQIKFLVETAWDVPLQFLQTLTNKLTSINEDVYLSGMFEDESFDPCGAFVYGVDGYSDVEELDDDDIDYERLQEDPDYIDEIVEMLVQLENDMIVMYREYLKDLEQ